MDAWATDRESGRVHLAELVRGATLRLYNVQLQSKDRMADPAKFWRMWYDEDPGSVEKDLAHTTEEERAEMERQFLEKLEKAYGR